MPKTTIGSTGSTFRSGDLMLSTLTNAPSGWTDVSATYNNKFLRISSGTPLSTGGSDTDSITLATTNLPSHTHPAGTLSAGSAGNHTHSMSPLGKSGAGSGFYHGTYTNFANNMVPYTMGTAGAHTHTISGSTGSTGSGTAFTVDTVPAYIQIRIFKKG